MRKSLKIKIFAAVLCVMLCFAAVPVMAYQPEEALAPKPEKSVYTILRLDNLGNFLRWLVSERAVKLFAPAAGLDDAMAAMITGAIAAVPAESCVIECGVEDDDSAFAQLIVKLPKALQGKLDLVAKGEAKAEDLAALVLGETSPVAEMASAMLEVKKDEATGLLSVLDTVFIGAKGDLLIAAVSAADVLAAINAVDKEELRMKLERKFSAKDFIISHVDMDVLRKIAPAEETGVSKKDYEAALGMLDEPIHSETAFENLADRFRISFNVNMSALAERFEKLLTAKPVKGGYINLMGDRSPLLALGTNLDGENIKVYPGFADVWGDAVNALKAFNISEQTLINFLTGSFALTIGNSLVSFEGMKVPAVFMTQVGSADSAAEIMSAAVKQADKLLMPVEAEGWNGLYQVDSSVSPVSVLLGLKGKMLYAGMADKDSLSAVPDVSGAKLLAEIMSVNSLGSGYIDFKGVQDYFKGDGAGVIAMAGMFAPMALGDKAEAVMAAVNEILDAKLSVPSVGFYSPEYGTCIMDFMTEKLDNIEDGLCAKLMKLNKILNAPDEKQDEKKDEAK